MAIESYDDLQARMAKYLKRQDLVDLIPDFIMLAEEQFDISPTMYVRARLSSYIVTPYDYLVPLPSDWRRVKNVWYDGKPLTFLGPGQQTGYAGGTDISYYGAYQIINNNLSFTAANAQIGSKLQIDYYVALESLSETNTSNWLLEDSPTAYLFGSLVQAAIYVRDQVNMQVWAAMRDQAIEAMITADKLAETPEDGPLTIMPG
jgi:hypothetical protein